MDRFSQLPDHVIDKILCSLPLLDAVKTCALAKAWRHIWVTLSKFQFEVFWADRKSFERGACWIVNSLTNLLIQHIGTLDEFRLEFPLRLNVESVDITPLMKFALEKGVKTLSLQFCAVPACVYSCTQLACLELALEQSSFFLPASFEGLPNLVSFKLKLYRLNGEDSDKIMQFISCCPKIKRLSLDMDGDRLSFDMDAVKDLRFCAPALEYLSLDGQIPFVCLQETENLKELVLDSSRANIGHICFAEKCGKMNCFFNGLVKLEYLTLGARTLPLFFTYGAAYPSRLPRMLEQLKTLKLLNLEPDIQDVFGVVPCFLASSPNLCKLIINIYPEIGGNMEIDPWYQDQNFENLRTVIVYTEFGEHEIKMIDFLLGHSPNLEMMRIYYFLHEDMDLFFDEVKRITPASSKARVQFIDHGTLAS